MTGRIAVGCRGWSRRRGLALLALLAGVVARAGGPHRRGPTTPSAVLTDAGRGRVRTGRARDAEGHPHASSTSDGRRSCPSPPLALLAVGARRRPAASSPPRRRAPAQPRRSSTDRLADAIARAQDRLRRAARRPRDLGRARARLRRAGPGHRRPGLYPKAEGALRRSLAVRATGQRGRARRARRAGQRPARLRRRPRRFATRRAARQPVRRRGVRRARRRGDPARQRTPRPPPRSSACSTCGPAWPRTPAPRTTWSSAAGSPRRPT